MSIFDLSTDELCRQRWAAGRKEHGRPGDGGFNGDDLEMNLEEQADSLNYIRVSRRRGRDPVICDQFAAVAHCQIARLRALHEQVKLDELAGRFERLEQA